MIFCKELNKSFNTESEMIKAIKLNLPEIIKAKMDATYKSCEKGVGVSLTVIKHADEADKAALEMDDDHYYIVVNSCNILDSHDDLHIRGIWDDSVISEQGKNYLIFDHYLSPLNTIVKKEHIEQIVADISFSALGKNYPGRTQVLVYKFRKDSVISDVAQDWLESKDAIEASVRMRYDEIEFALDSNDPDDKDLKKAFDKYFPKIANSGDFEYIRYFFAIKKARNVFESSLVIRGSNPVTGAISIGAKKEEIENIDQAETSQKLKSSLLLT